MPRQWTHDRATHVAAVARDREAADVVGFLFDLAAGHPKLRVRVGTGSHPTFLADLHGSLNHTGSRRGRTPPYLYSVHTFHKLVYFVPERIDKLIHDARQDWFTSRLTEAFGPAIRIGTRKFYWSISMADLAHHKDEMLRLVEDTTQRIGTL